MLDVTEKVPRPFSVGTSSDCPTLDDSQGKCPDRSVLGHRQTVQCLMIIKESVPAIECWVIVSLSGKVRLSNCLMTEKMSRPFSVGTSSDCPMLNDNQGKCPGR